MAKSQKVQDTELDILISLSKKLKGDDNLPLMIIICVVKEISSVILYSPVAEEIRY